MNLRHPDTRCGLAVEERDLLREARDEDNCAGAMLETIFALYPARILPSGVIVNPQHN